MKNIKTTDAFSRSRKQSAWLRVIKYLDSCILDMYVINAFTVFECTLHNTFLLFTVGLSNLIVTL
jgi:hypothetical protein